jgi:small subunit ribosomal protein S20
VASHASALKAHRQNIERRERNRQFRTRLTTALKRIRTAADKNELDTVKDKLRSAVSLVDRMAAKGIVHKNTAARYKSRLHARAARAQAKAHA